MSLNIEFAYLYRDAGNYKKWGKVVFSNPDKLSMETVKSRILNTCLDGESFIASQVRLPEVFLYFEEPANEDDHGLHEFDSVKSTSEGPSDALNRTIFDFLKEFEIASRNGWRSIRMSLDSASR